jgi:general secretion pathway protein D
LEVILGVLESKNLYFEERAGTLFVYRTRPGAPRPAEIRIGEEVPDSPANILQVVVLKYARPVELDPLLREFYKTGVAIKIHPRENALILSGQASAIKAMMEFIQIFDVPYVVGKKAFIVKLLYWQPDEFMKQMTQILDGTGFNIARTSRDAGILFIPIKFVNSLLVLAPDDASAKYVLEWKERLDTAESAGTEEKAFTYVPEYAKAAEIVESIRKVYGVLPSEAPLQPGAPPQAPGARPPTQQPPRTAPGQTAAPVTGPGLKIAADERRNVVLAVTTPSNYKSILVLLKELDTPVKQVLIETTIAELTLTDELRLGFEFFIKEKVKNGSISLGTLGQLGLPGGLQYSYISAAKDLQALMELLQTENRANILSRPRLMVLDNQEATIQVGDEVPIVTSEVSATDIGAPSVQRNIQYRRTGLILTIKPTINARGLLTLDISQEVSDAIPTKTSGIDSPTITTRRIRTSVVAGDGQTVALGGLMRDKVSGGKSKVPWLGDLPVLGYLFKSESSTKEKTELIVLISPRILSSVDETTRVTEELKQELRWLK